MSWTTTNPSDRPDWLATDAENPSVKNWETADVVSQPSTELSPTASATASDAPVGGSGGSGGHAAGDPSSAAKADRGPWCKRLTIMGISALFMATFIYSAIVQKNDDDRILWYSFYAVSAVIPAFFLCHYILCFPPKVIYLLSTAMAVWSIVYIVLNGLKIGDHPKVEGGDDNNNEVRNEYIFEVAGSGIALLSALYHICMVRCCTQKNGGKADE